MKSISTTCSLVAAEEVAQDRSIFIRDCISQVISGGGGAGEDQPQNFEWIDQVERSASKQGFEAPRVGLMGATAR